jgi:hypothetical protein
VNFLEQLDALHARHDLIGDDDRERLAVALELVHQLERVLARLRVDPHRPKRAPAVPQRRGPLLVVHAQDVRASSSLADLPLACGLETSSNPPQACASRLGLASHRATMLLDDLLHDASPSPFPPLRRW